MSKIYAYKIPFRVSDTLLCLSLSVLVAVSAQAEDDPAVEGNVDKPEATIWLEEKIAPSSRWMEELVQPMTNWMEERLHGKPVPQANLVSEPPEEVPAEEVSADLVFIEPEQAETIARDQFPGEVLHSKLLSASQRYRIKLLTAEGVIHVVYVDAVNAVILPQEE